jgi:predicted dehydrogenase
VKIRLGIIGTGLAARHLHLPALHSLRDRFDIAVVCSRTKESARDFANLAGGVPYALNYREVLERSDVDAVDILLPIHLNYAVARDALKAGKHVIVEKPLAASLGDARRLLELAASSKKVALVAENFRYRPAYQIAKSILDTGRIGAPRFVMWTSLTLMDAQNDYAQTEWRMHHKHLGGLVTDSGVHYIAGIRMMFGEIESGFARTQSLNPSLGAMDTAEILLRTRSGVDVAVILSFSLHGPGEDRMLVFGTRGSMTLGPGGIDVTTDGGATEHTAIPDSWGYREELEDFHRAIVSGSAPISSVLEGYQDLEVILRAVGASPRGGRFRVPAR